MKPGAVCFLGAILLAGCAKTTYPDMVRDKFKHELDTAEGWRVERWTTCEPAKSSYAVTVTHTSAAHRTGRTVTQTSAEHTTYRFHIWAHDSVPTVDVLRPDRKTIWLTVETWKRPFTLKYQAKMPQLSAEEEAYLRDLIEQLTTAFTKATA